MATFMAPGEAGQNWESNGVLNKVPPGKDEERITEWEKGKGKEKKKKREGGPEDGEAGARPREGARGTLLCTQGLEEVATPGPSGSPTKASGFQESIFNHTTGARGERGEIRGE